MAANKRHRTPRRKRRISIEAYAEKLRKNPTRAELVLWALLKRRMVRWGVEFEFQGIVLGRFIPDFVCREKMLIIEVDGSIHKLDHIKERDRYRTGVLNSHGYRIMRFTNWCVLTKSYFVVNTIEREL